VNTESAVVFIIDHEAGVRAALQRLFASVHLQVAVFAGSEDFLAASRAAGPGCLLLEVRPPDLYELEFHRQLPAYRIELPVIITTPEASVPMAVTAMKQGAFDFIEKPFNEQQLLDSVQSALEHDRIRYQQRLYRQQVQDRADTLTARERDVMVHISRGLTNEEIAVSLALSHKTVAAHRARLMAKMQARSLAQLMRMALLVDARDQTG
jgi:FixJ family two-component response regulator